MRTNITTRVINRFKVGFSVAAALACLTTAVQAAQGLSVTNEFPAVPAVGDWSTLSVAGGAGDYTDAATLDAAVIANTAATAVTTVLGTSGTQPPSQNAIARFNTAGLYLQTRPTGNGYLILMTTLVNDSGSTIANLLVTYDWAQRNNPPVNENISGHRAFWSLTGAAGSWTLIPEFSTFTVNDTATNLSATLPVGSWAAGANMYIVWADDNGPGSTTDPQEGAYTIDNFYAASAAPPSPIVIVTQPPLTVQATQGLSASWELEVTGSAPRFQWYRQEAGVFQPVLGATGARITIPRVSLADATNFHCIITNSFPSAVTSRDTRVIVTPDTTPPVLVSVEPVLDLTWTNFTARWSELVDPGTAQDTVNYTLCLASDETTCLSILSLVLQADGSSVLISVDPGTPATKGVDYKLTATGVADLAGMPSATDKIFPIPFTWQQGEPVGEPYLGCQDTELKGSQPSIAQGVCNETITGCTNILVDQDDGGAVSQGLLRFDNIIGDGPGLVPLGANIVYARIRLTSSADNANTAGPVYAFTMLTPWDQATATFDGFGGGGVKADGIQAGITPLASFNAAFGNPTTVGPQTRVFDITAAVQEWANGAPNYGILMTNDATDGYRFDSSEAAGLDDHPVLFIAYNLEQKPVSFTSVPNTNLIVVTEGQPFSITYGVAGTLPQLQWFKNSVAVPGETNVSLVRPVAVPPDAGTYFLRATNNASATNSGNTVVQVTADTTAPGLLSVRSISTNLSYIALVFSELMSDSASNAANYTVTASGGAGVNPIAATVTGTNVLLQLAAPLVLGQNYTVAVGAAVTDRAFAANALTNGTQTLTMRVILLSGPGTAWTYNPNGDCLDGQAWNTSGYDVSSWSNGVPLFVAKTTTPGAHLTNFWGPEITRMAITNLAGTAQVTTYYFRTIMNLPFDPSSFTDGIVLQYVVDDGAVFYANGSEIGFVGVQGLTNRPIYCTNFGTRTQGNDYPSATAPFETGAPAPITVPLADLTSLIQGDNVIAAEVHQVNATSSDVAFGLQIYADITTFGAPRPRITIWIDSLTGNINIAWTVGGTLQQSADMSPGSWTAVVGATNPYVVTPGTTPAKRFYRIAP